MKLLFLITEDWFFVSHFLPMGRAAQQIGFEVVVATRISNQKALLEAEAFRVTPIAFRRRSLSIFHNVALLKDIVRLFQSERPDIVHNIALKPVIIGTVAARLSRISTVVNAITGLGYTAVAKGWNGIALRSLLKWIVRVLPGLIGPGHRYIFENTHDVNALLGDHNQYPRSSLIVIGGAGVDVHYFQPLPQPNRLVTTVTVALVSRMLWSKGIDIAVAAIEHLHSEGLRAKLLLVGNTDKDNPHAFTEQQLQQWDSHPGIEWCGYHPDVREVWRQADIAILPSRGGEGLPRVLLEAAACSRPIITTAVPGCGDFVLQGQTGLIIPADKPLALANAIRYLAEHPAERKLMGEMARNRVEKEYTESHIAHSVGVLYRELSEQGVLSLPK